MGCWLFLISAISKLLSIGRVERNSSIAEDRVTGSCVRMLNRSKVLISRMVNLAAEPKLDCPVLSVAEKVRLNQLEFEIERNLTGFIKCGRCLLEIRESRLWRGQYADYSSYCRERFAIARSTADQLCRSTQVYESLNATLAGGDAPGPETPEIVLRPLSQLPGDELKAETWRLAASLSPNGQPTRTIAARVTRLIKSVIAPSTKEPKGDRDPMFTRPILRLAKVNSFDPGLAVTHVTTPAQATRIVHACQTVAGRCQQIVDQLNQRFS